LATLEARGLRENTLVIFTSDNGFSCGQHGIWGKGNGTFPQSMYQESVTVPFLISQPGRIPAGQVREELLSAYDLAPTLRQWCHLPGTDDPLAAGTSFAGLLTGAEAAPERGPVVVYDEYGPVRMIRTGRWKYIHRHPYGPHELYDLDADPRERRSLATDPGHAARCRDLAGRMQEWFLHHHRPAHDGAGLPVTGAGQVDLLRPRTALGAFRSADYFRS